MKNIFTESLFGVVSYLHEGDQDDVIETHKMWALQKIFRFLYTF